MISACITDPFAGWLRIKDYLSTHSPYPETGCKRQAAPSLERSYCGRMICVNSGPRGGACVHSISRRSRASEIIVDAALMPAPSRAAGRSAQSKGGFQRAGRRGSLTGIDPEPPIAAGNFGSSESASFEQYAVPPLGQKRGKASI
jgi:hypothetical protein